MIEVCKNHQDYLVVYDCPIIRDCPICRLEIEHDNIIEEAEAVPDLKDEIEELKQEIIIKDLNLKTANDEIADFNNEKYKLETELEEYMEEVNTLRQIADEYYKKG